MTLCFTSRKLWRIMLRAAGPIVGRIYRYYIMYETTIKFQFSFLIQKRVLFYSLTQRSLPTSWGTWTSPERIGKRAKIFILKGLELFNTLRTDCERCGFSHVSVARHLTGELWQRWGEGRGAAC